MQRIFPFLAIAAILAAQSGCLYTNVHAPRAYRSATPADVKGSADDAIVTGKACSRTLLYMFAWGDAGYAAAARDALKDHPHGILYDVKNDVKATSYLLGLYAQGCTMMTGRVAQE